MVSCVNSVAHWVGHTPCDDKHSLRLGDHLLTALITLGEGHHNSVINFPCIIVTQIKWYQYDPTK